MKGREGRRTIDLPLCFYYHAHDTAQRTYARSIFTKGQKLQSSLHLPKLEQPGGLSILVSVRGILRPRYAIHC